MNDKERQIIVSRFERVPRLHIGYYPTPLEEMTRLGEALGGGPRLFIKRDDYTGAGFGGNKVRKLDYMLAQAVADAAKVVITIGGEKSNHARVTAAMCARLGLRCILVLNRAATASSASYFKPASLVVDEMVGAEIHLVDSREERRSRATEIAAHLREQGKRVMEIPLGASVPLGALGFARAMQEVMTQFTEIGARPTHIFHSSSSGGTQAGLLVGLQLFAEEDINIIGVSPDDPAAAITASVAEIVNGIHQLLETDLRISAAQVQVLDQYIGEGYGIQTPEGIAAAKLLAAREGIILDPTYTAKAFAALLDWINTGKLTAEDTVLFWHTGGQLALFYAPE